MHARAREGRGHPDAHGRPAPGRLDRRPHGRVPVRDTPADDPGHADHDAEAAVRHQPAELDTTIAEPLYDVHDSEAAIHRFVGVDYDPAGVAPGITATLHDAGHILGSAIVILDVEEAGATRRLVFSGDLGRPARPSCATPRPSSTAPTTCSWSRPTAAASTSPRKRPSACSRRRSRRSPSVTACCSSRPSPSGAPRRSSGSSTGWWPRAPSPTCRCTSTRRWPARRSDIYRRYPGYYDEETHQLLEAGETPIDYPGAVVTNTPEASRAIATAPRPLMIVAASGMLTGGRIVHHLRTFIDDPAATILFVGYQGQGTLGAHLQAGAKQVRLDGRMRDVRCQIRSISGFSAHADENELIDWLSHLAKAPRRPRRVFLVHGDPDAEAGAQGQGPRAGAHRPTWREEVDLG